MDEDPADAQQIGHLAGVLRAGAAEAAQARSACTSMPRWTEISLIALAMLSLAMARQPCASSSGGALDRRSTARPRAPAPRTPRAPPRRRAAGRRLAPNTWGKKLGQELADHQIGVGDRERPAAAVAGRARVGAGTLGADPEALAVEADDRSAAGRHGVDLHHRRPDPHARDLGVERPLERAGIMGDVGRGAAHVEADDPVEARQRRGPGGADDAAGRAGEDRVLALEQARVDQPAIALHEHQPHVAGRGGDAVDIGAQDRRQVGVDHGGVAAADELHQRADLVADRDLGVADGAGDLGHGQLVRVVAVAVHQHDRDRPVARHRMPPARSARARSRSSCLLDGAVGAQPLLDLDRAGVELLGQDDVPGEDVGPVLVADAQGVAETAR